MDPGGRSDHNFARDHAGSAIAFSLVGLVLRGWLWYFILTGPDR
jgi:hypothetical protein